MFKPAIVKTKSKPHFLPGNRSPRPGFALVVTLVLMVLLSILALGLLSLASVELRTSGVSKHDAIARQNALLAMQLAIGELQKHLGPDKRTSANAELVDALFEDTNPHWVGAWNTEGGFRTWLVSGNEQTIVPADPTQDATSAAHNPGAVLATGTISDPGVILVGAASAGEASTPGSPDNKHHVVAPAVALRSPDSSLLGRYAWWVGDEGGKANLAAAVEKLPAASADVSEHLMHFASSPNRGFPSLGEPWKRWLPDGPNPLLVNSDGKFPSRRQVTLADGALVEEMKEHFHDFTVTSAGVMSDSNQGGLKKDLSIAFEIPEEDFEKSEFTRVLVSGEPDQDLAFATDHDTPGGRAIYSSSSLKGRSTKTAVNYRDPSWDASFVYRGPTFDQLRDHYQLYRRVEDPFGSDASIQAQTYSPGSLDMSYNTAKTNTLWHDFHGAQFQWNSNDLAQGENDAVEDIIQHGNNSPAIRIRPLTTELVPEVQHHAYTMALQSYKEGGDPPGYSRMRLFVHPYFTLYNPYNVEITSPPISITVARAEVAAKFELQGDPPTDIGTKKTVWLATLYPVDSTSGGDAVTSGYQSQGHILSDSGSSAYAPDAIRLRPGEIKLYTISGNKPFDMDTLAALNRSDRILSFQAVDPSSPGQLFRTGMYKELRYRYDDVLTPPDADKEPDPYLVPDGIPFKLTVDNAKYIEKGGRGDRPPLGSNGNEFYELSWSMESPGGTSDSVRKVRTFNGTYWLGEPINNDSPLYLNTSEIAGDVNAADGGNKRFVGQTDNFWKPTKGGVNSDSNISLATHNHRAPVQSNSGTGGQGPNATRGPATWEGTAELLDGGAPNLNLRFWGSSTDPAVGGQDYVTLFEVPRVPLTSIAEFTQANLSRAYTAPAYALGNSYASPYIPAEDLWWRSGAASNASADRMWTLDDSYIFNEALFDSYFFSSLNPGLDGNSWNNRLPESSVRLGSGDPTKTSPLQTRLDAWRTKAEKLLNPHIRFILPSGKSVEDAEDDLDLGKAYSETQESLESAEDIRPHNAIASYILNTGAFNVNSTSVPAWRAMLAGQRDAAVSYFMNTGSLDVNKEDEETPFQRTSPGAEDQATGDDRNLWNGYRSLSDADIDGLAQAIVVEVKRRARDRGPGKAGRPFTTLAEFINRKQAPPSDPSSLKGILQTALDDKLNDPASLTGYSAAGAQSQHVTKKKTSPGETVTIPYVNPGALAASTIAGAPQWLMQSDILENIGQRLSARSDTFVIRAYGESISAEDNQVGGRAWLEATVQREPGFVDSANDPALPLTSPGLTEANKNYGRRFRIISLQWLSPQEL